MAGDEAAEVLAVIPRGVGGNEGGPEQFAGRVIDREQQRLLVLGRPPGVEGGVVLPAFAEAGALPAAAGLEGGCGRADEQWEVAAGIGGNGATVALESKAGGQCVGDELVVGGAAGGAGRLGGTAGSLRTKPDDGCRRSVGR